jgi:signal transduction histidine kinase
MFGLKRGERSDMMMATPQPELATPGTARWRHWIIPAAILYGTFFEAWLIWQPGGSAWLAPFDDSASLLALLSLAPLALYLARRQLEQWGRVAWLCVASGVLLFSSGNAIWDWSTLALDQEHIAPIAASICYAFGYLIMLIAVMLLPLDGWQTRRSWLERCRLLTDALIAVGAVFILVWYFALGPAIFAASGSWNNRIVAAAFPIADLMLGAYFITLILRMRAFTTISLLFSSALLVITAADASYAYLTLHGWYHTGMLLDGVWVAGYMLLDIAMAATIKSPKGSPLADGNASILFWQTQSQAKRIAAETVVTRMLAGGIDSPISADGEQKLHQPTRSDIFAGPGQAGLPLARWLELLLEFGAQLLPYILFAAAGMLVIYSWVINGDKPLAAVLQIVLMLLLILLVVRQTIALTERTRLAQAARIEAQRAQHRADEAQALAGSLLESMSEGVAMADHHGRMVYWSTRMARWFALPANLVLGRPGHELMEQLMSLVRAPEAVRAAISAALIRLDERPTFTLTLTGPPVRDLRVRLFPVCDEHGKTSGIGAVASDITLEREAERLRSQFVAIASHELRTPLATIAGFLELLQARDASLSPEKRRLYLEEARRQADRLTGIMSAFLDLSRLEAGREKLQLTPLSPALIIREAISRVPPDSRHCISIAIAPHTPAVCADATRVGQVLDNLLDNARKYSPDGGPIQISARRDSSDPGQVRFTVRDYGLGIPLEQQQKLFIPFARAEEHSRRGIGGTGLGLAIARQIIEHHGGRIWLESKPAEGTAVHFTLPAAASPPST